jgi:hypothetical protein
MLDAQSKGRRLPASAEWYLGRSYLQIHNPEAEEDFITGPREWTGTVLDYDRDQILEGITLKPNGDIANVKTRLGKKEGFKIPDESKYVKDIPERYMKTIAHIWGLQDPKRELPDYAFLYVPSSKSGFRPVVRGGDWFLHYRDDGRVDANASFDAAVRGFAARYVSETPTIITEITRPAEVREAEYRISKTEYETLVAKAEELEQGISELRDMLSQAVIIE